MTKVSKNRTDDHVVIDWTEADGFEAEISRDGGAYTELNERYARFTDQDFIDLGRNWRDKSEGTANWVTLVGHRLTENNVVDIFKALTSNPDGNDLAGISLIGLTEDSFTITVEGKYATDKFTFQGENVEALIEELGSTDGKSANNQIDEFYVLNTDPDSDDSVTFQSGPEASIVGVNGFNPSSKSDVEKVIEAALDQSNDKAKLLTLTEDSVSLQVEGRVDKNGNQDGLDTILLTGALVEDFIAGRTEADQSANPRSSSEEFVFLSAEEIEAAQGANRKEEAALKEVLDFGGGAKFTEEKALVGTEVDITAPSGDEVAELILAAENLDNVTAQDMGTSIALYVEDVTTGAQDIIIYEDALLLA